MPAALPGGFRTLSALSGEIWTLRSSQMAKYRPKTDRVSQSGPNAPGVRNMPENAAGTAVPHLARRTANGDNEPTNE